MYLINAGKVNARPIPNNPNLSLIKIEFPNQTSLLLNQTYLTDMFFVTSGPKPLIPVSISIELVKDKKNQ